jgi:Fe-S-cluster containining protein
MDSRFSNGNCLDMDRHPKSRRLLRRILQKADCLTCGKCCQNPGKKFKIAVLGFDPFHEHLRSVSEKEFPGRMEEMPNGGFNLIGDDRCVLQMEGNLCAAYNVRPLVCATFPFLLKPMIQLHQDGSTNEAISLALTTSCPPIREAKEAGVTYVSLDDLITQATVNGRDALVSDMPILGPIMSILLNQQGEFYHPSHFVVREKRIIFPVS